MAQSPNARASLKIETFLAVQPAVSLRKKRERKGSCTCLAAPGILANGSVVKGRHSVTGVSCKVGFRICKGELLECHIFPCVRQSRSNTLFVRVSINNPQLQYS